MNSISWFGTGKALPNNVPNLDSINDDIVTDPDLLCTPMDANSNDDAVAVVGAVESHESDT